VEISQADLERLMENWSNGGPSPFYKRKDRLLGDEPIAVATFVGERVRWIGKVDTDMFSTRGHKDFGVYVGVSPYRAVFYRAASVFSDLCRSYWFQVDTGGRTWQTGRVRRREYRAIELARPRFKKGLVGRQILFAGNLTRVSGKVDTAFEHELDGLEWLNPQSGKFEGRKGQSLYDQLIEVYDHHLPISVGELWLMENDTRRAIVTAPGGGEVAREEATELAVGGGEEQVLETRVEEAPVTAVREEAEEEADSVCPECGRRLRPGVPFCGQCGHRLGGEQEVVALVAVAGEERSVVECPGCGAPLKPGVRFCGKCGRGLRMEEEPEELPADEETEQEEAETVQASVEADARSCATCGRPMQADWQACPYCGSRVTAGCPQCGKESEPDWVACPFCGGALKDRQARL
jgi:predicted amidophosphoribosyltransferase